MDRTLDWNEDFFAKATYDRKKLTIFSTVNIADMIHGHCENGSSIHIRHQSMEIRAAQINRLPITADSRACTHPYSLILHWRAKGIHSFEYSRHRIDSPQIMNGSETIGVGDISMFCRMFGY
jgi:hypothetical protein